MRLADLGAMARAAGFGLLLAMSLLACGGRTEGGSPAPGDPAPGDDPGSDEGADTGCGALHGQCGAQGDTALGECKLGFSVFETGQPCAWIADDRCYDTREMACNCECPRDRDSQCFSGFDNGPDGHVLVECR
jgi:hypothetical protein